MKTGRMIVLAIVALATCACLCPVAGMGFGGIRGSGRVVEETFDVDNFTGVNLATFGDLTIEVGDEEELRIEAEKNLMPYFEAQVVGGMLKIDTRPGVSLHPTRRVKYYLTVTKLDTIQVTGSGNITAPGLEGEQVSVTIHGSGDVEIGNLDGNTSKIELTGSGRLDVSEIKAQEQDIVVTGSGDLVVENLNVDTIEVRITGSGKVNVNDGQAGEQQITLSGSGDYRAEDVKSDKANVRTHGSGSAAVWVEEHLEARISGSGDVRYTGRPRIEQLVTGSGNIMQIDR
ncbi:MAG: DUF2807 domain-containing protein [Chloroflexi bacterium]|nr:DUF2807 domain-containing protein [Chloroflexota bacterium]